MKPVRSLSRPRRQGAALVLSLIFIVMFSALAVAMAGLSGVNVQLAENQRKVGSARASAESGLEVVRFWMSRVHLSGTTPANQRFIQLAASLQDELDAAGITNLAPVVSGSTITISDVPLHTGTGQSFSAILAKIDDDNVQLEVTGYYGPFSRTIRSNYYFGTRANTVFDFGVASKGPISLSGNVDLQGVNIQVESNAYIESPNNLLALSVIGNSSIGGTVKIVNPDAYVHLQGGQASIGGATGAAAMNNVEIGAPPSEFPEMNPEDFFHYATNFLDPAASTSTTATYENLRIPAGMNPSFSAQTTLRGVIYIESPNVVTFSGGVNITAIIVTDGDPTDNSAENRLIFTGNVTGNPVSQLPQETQFAGLHDQTGTFILAPGFHVGFGGSFTTLSGVIAANGIELWGNAGGTINGSIINYSDAPMTLSGNTDLYFNRSGLDQIPVGFTPEIIVFYDPTSYSEVIL
jgi:hypothetical protein